MSPAISKNLFVKIGSALLLLAVFCPASAAETYFNICLDRSVNIVPPQDKTKISDLGDVVTINKKGRLWLTGNETREGYDEIVCQNLSSESVNITMAKEDRPWLQISGPAECDAWRENLLICPVGGLEKGIFCKITERNRIRAAEDASKQMSASVNVRAIDIDDDPKKWFDEQLYLQKRINYYAAGIDLCANMHDKTGRILISWIIYAGGSVDQVEIDRDLSQEDRAIANCIAEQIGLWKFPEWRKNSQVSYQF